MIEFFDTIGSYINKITTAFDTVFTNIKQSISELKYWIDFLPSTLITAALIIVVLLVIFRILGR